MSRPVKHPLYAAGILEQTDDLYLIVRPAGDDSARLWRFPRGPVGSGESPEEALRRIARDDLDLGLDIVIGQPPLTVDSGGTTLELRYFFCAVTDGEPKIGPYAETRWILKQHLREYDFDECSQPVVDWLLEG